MLVESGNPAHSLADGPRMREALAALDLVVVIDVAMTETARLAHYVLPVASQFEKAEATFFNFEFPHNYFHLRKALMRAAAGAVLRGGAARAAGRGARRAAAGRGRRRCAPPGTRAAPRSARSSSSCSARTRALVRGRAGPALPRDRRSPARGSRGGRRGLGRCARSCARQDAESLARAGFAGEPAEAADALFDALLASKSAVVFSVDDWEESFARVRHAEPAHPARDPRAVRRARRARERARARRARGLPVRALRGRAALVHREHDHPQPGVAAEGPRAARCA